MSRYSALIRTFNCERTLAATLECLRKQTCPPAEYVFIDSGSTDGTLSLAPPGALVRAYEGAEFNYSSALNQGIGLVSNPYTLVISSHTLLAHPGALEFALTRLDSDTQLGAAYFSNDNDGGPRMQRIDGGNFDGFNGLWNTCSVLRTPLARKRPFRPEVFSAEDQEWAHWLFDSAGLAVARLSGCGMKVLNPRQASRKKRLNEYVAVAYYSRRNLLGFGNLASIARKMLARRGPYATLQERLFHMSLLLRLIACRFAEPHARSRYF